MLDERARVRAPVAARKNIRRRQSWAMNAIPGIPGWATIMATAIGWITARITVPAAITPTPAPANIRQPASSARTAIVSAVTASAILALATLGALATSGLVIMA